MSLDPATDIVHAVKAAKEERLGQPDSGIGFGWLRYAADTELSGRPLPSIVFNYLGAGAAARPRSSRCRSAVRPGRAGASPAGGMVAQGILNITAGAGLVDGKRWLSATVLYPHAVLTESDVRDLLDHWAGELAAVAQLVTAGVDVGMSPSDVPGVDLTQDDIDHLARAYPARDCGHCRRCRVVCSSSQRWPVAWLTWMCMWHRRFCVSTVPTARGCGQPRRSCGPTQRAAVGFRADRVRFGGRGRRRARRSPWTDVDLTGWTMSPRRRGSTNSSPSNASRHSISSAPPLLRFVLVRHGDSATLIVTNHHIILDGWSGPLVLADMLALYATGSTYTEQVSGGATGDFGDYLRTIAGRDDDAAFAAWRQVLAPVEGPTLVAAGQQATADAMPRDLETLLDADLIADLEAAARAEARPWRRHCRWRGPSSCRGRPATRWSRSVRPSPGARPIFRVWNR